MRYRWFSDPDKEVDEFGVRRSRAADDPTLAPPKIGYARGELLAIVIACVIFLYESYAGDLPLLFVALSFILYELRPLALLFLGARGRFVAGFLRGFSLALFAFTMLWIFL